MGTIANQVVNGFLCQVCITYMEDFKEPGYPRVCKECQLEEKKETEKNGNIK